MKKTVYEMPVALLLNVSASDILQTSPLKVTDPDDVNTPWDGKQEL